MQTHGPSAMAADGSALEVLEIPVTGLECALCSRRLALHMEALAGVESATVSRGSGLLRVRYMPERISAANLFVEVRRVGFVPDGQKMSLRVKGMHCESCARAIERALGALAGVERVRADRVRSEVVVELCESVSIETVVGAVSHLGYEVVVERRGV